MSSLSPSPSFSPSLSLLSSITNLSDISPQIESICLIFDREDAGGQDEMVEGVELRDRGEGFEDQSEVLWCHFTNCSGGRGQSFKPGQRDQDRCGMSAPGKIGDELCCRILKSSAQRNDWTCKIMQLG